jgi:uncharacterized protein involved in copper resistance
VQVIDVPPATPATDPPTPPRAPALPTGSASRASGRPAPTEPGRSAAAGSPSPPSPSPSASAAGAVRSYTLHGGRVALLVTGDSASLVTATPDAGFAVQTWSGTDWLRVDFSSGGQVSSLIASWYQHSPNVTVEN